MSLSQQTIFERPADDRKRSVYGFVLAVACVALVFVIANVMFTHAFVGGELIGPYVGP